MGRESDALCLENFQALVEDLLGQGYEVVGFDRVEPDCRHLILRHDVDMSPRMAVALAELEQRIGVRAVYFVLLRSDLYSAISDSNVRHLNQIAELGHEIGLHFDASLYADDPERLEAAADQECQILESVLGGRIETISFHRPAQSVLNGERPLAGRLHAYQSRFFSDIGYCSDSRGGWFRGHPLEHQAVREGRALQLLTHPIWWVAPEPDTPAQALERFVGQHVEMFERDLADNCEPYRQVLTDRGDPSD